MPVEIPQRLLQEFSLKQQTELRKIANLVYDAAVAGGGGVDELTELLDVDITSVFEGDVLTWDSFTEAWINSPIDPELYEYELIYSASCGDPVLLRLPLSLFDAVGTGTPKTIIGNLVATVHIVSFDNTVARSFVLNVSLGKSDGTMGVFPTNGATIGTATIAQQSQAGLTVDDVVYNTASGGSVDVRIVLDEGSSVSGTAYGKVMYNGAIVST